MQLVKFGSGATQFRDNNGMDLAVVQHYAPSVFADEKHESRTERYTQIKTKDVLAALIREGFQIVYIAQGGSRIEGKRDFTKHLIRLRHSDWKDKNGRALEILLYNAHDGTCSYRMLGGVFEFVCCNGLVLGDSFCDVKVKHTGRNVLDDVVHGCFRALESFPKISDHIAELQATIVPPSLAVEFANSAIDERFAESIERNGHAPISAADALRPRRFEDAGSDLWSTFNRIQENLTQGGVHYTAWDDRRSRVVNRETRPIQEIGANTTFNQRLHAMAERMQTILNGGAAA